MSQIPSIQMSDICFIRAITLPNFNTKLEELKNSDFSFLYALKDYLKYYIDLDSSSDRSEREFLKPSEISNLGIMRPLRRHHALNSYWKWLRLSLENEMPIVDNPKELYFLLPLRIDIPGKSIKANGIKFPVKLFIYLFPFGSCTVNMNIKVDNSYDFDQYIDLIDKLSRAEVETEKTFKATSSYIAQRINQTIFNDNNVMKSISPHSMIFIKKTDSLLKFDEIETPDHFYAISALMAGKRVDDVRTINFKDIKDELLGYQVKLRRNRELLFFKPSRSLIYPDPGWSSQFLYLKGSNNLKKGNMIFRRKLACMQDNYQSFLNLTFAVNRFIKDFLIYNKKIIPAARLKSLINCFSEAFPEKYTEEGIPVYFKHFLAPLAQSIGLFSNINELKSQ